VQNDLKFPLGSEFNQITVKKLNNMGILGIVVICGAILPLFSNGAPFGINREKYDKLLGPEEFETSLKSVKGGFTIDEKFDPEAEFIIYGKYSVLRRKPKKPNGFSDRSILTLNDQDFITTGMFILALTNVKCKFKKCTVK